jgi:serine/threonine protein phosphatase PrpC
MRLICAGLTDVGVSREHNEDFFYLSQEGEPLCVVADGMGGHRSGEVASELAVNTITKYYQETVLDPEEEVAVTSRFSLFKKKRKKNVDELRLVQSLLCANKLIFEESERNEKYKGMGTTIVAAYFMENGVYIAHIGDSRCYRLRDQKLELLTEDHSLANEYVRLGILSPEDLEFFPYKNVVTRACGLQDHVEVESSFQEIDDRDVYLLCSDGLTDCVSDKDILRILLENENLNKAALALINAANAGGGTDNITVILAQTLLA